MMTNGGRVMFDELVIIDKKNTVVEFKNTFQMAARYPLKLEFYSMNYKGLDYSKDFIIDVKESSEERTVFYIYCRNY
jgi:hypothetical protein